ncbi:RNA polymerase II subunit A C-terminal domain phosphatase, partial [Takifugu flavidus]
MENPEPPGAQSPDTCLQGSNCQDSPPNTEESLGAPMGNEIPEEDITLETFQRLSERLTKVHQNKLHQSKKLVLMVDLDNTLIHATEEPCECSPNEDVWNYAPALIEVRPYFYFKDKDSSDNNQEDNDDYLPYLENVLKRIHTEYYSRYEAYQRKEITEVPDLSKIIPELRRKTLEGTTIVFSGLVPQGSALPIIAEYHCAQGLGAK